MLGHGARESQGSDEFVIKSVNLLRQKSIFGGVYEAFVRQEPEIEYVLKNIPNRPLFIIPMFMANGFILQRTLANLKNKFQILSDNILNTDVNLEKIIYFCEPIGTHNLMSEIIASKAIEILKQYPYPRVFNTNEISLFIAAHGCSKDSQSRITVQKHIVNLVHKKLFQDVHSVFLEEDPPINACYTLAETKNIVVVPFFNGNGPHVCEDIPILLGAQRKTVLQRLERGIDTWNNPTQINNSLVWYTSPVGNDIRIVEIIIRRVIESIYCLESPSTH